jgi:hypothetical protein
VKKTTTIMINGERWKVPRGFGVAYKREAQRQIAETLKPGKVIDAVVGAMLVVGYAPTREAVADWPLRKRVEAVIYGATEYARASDNPIRRHPRPDWLTVQPWQGPWSGEGAFSGPTPTEITS